MDTSDPASEVARKQRRDQVFDPSNTHTMTTRGKAHSPTEHSVMGIFKAIICAGIDKYAQGKFPCNSSHAKLRFMQKPDPFSVHALFSVRTTTNSMSVDVKNADTPVFIEEFNLTSYPSFCECILAVVAGSTKHVVFSISRMTNDIIVLAATLATAGVSIPQCDISAVAPSLSIGQWQQLVSDALQHAVGCVKELGLIPVLATTLRIKATKQQACSRGKKRMAGHDSTTHCVQALHVAVNDCDAYINRLDHAISMILLYGSPQGPSSKKADVLHMILTMCIYIASLQCSDATLVFYHAKPVAKKRDNQELSTTLADRSTFIWECFVKASRAFFTSAHATDIYAAEGSVESYLTDLYSDTEGAVVKFYENFASTVANMHEMCTESTWVRFEPA